MEYTNIYILSDPITFDVRYVGKTNSTKSRLYSHIKECNSIRISHKINWIKSLLSKGERPIISIIDVVPISEWQYWEKYWIEQFKQWGFNLTNQTEGGDGGKGYKHTDLAKDNMRKSKLGKPLSEEHKEKISKSVKEDWKNNPREVERIIILSKEDLYQKYIIENLSMPKLAKFYNCSENVIFNNLKEHNIKKDKSIWKKQLSVVPKKPVLQFDFNGKLVKEWDSISTAENNLNISGVSKCCKDKAVSVGGYIWRFKDEFIELDLSRLNYQKRKVSKFDLNGNFIESYDSIKEAAYSGFNEGNIQDCCVGRLKSHRNFLWRYAEDSPPIPYKNKTIKVVLQFDLENNFIKEWCSIAEASKSLNIGSNSITTCCKGKYKSSGGFIWRYK